MCATYRDKQQRSHFASFANTIFTGIREINPDYAEKRAIWELFQNALDTIQKNGEIEIAKTDKGMLFKHNGRPFTDSEFGGLIKQFSVGKTYGDNSKEVGQYGTGFISTHVYGKKIIVNGSILTDDGSYRILEDFELNRDFSDTEVLTDQLLVQDGIIEALCDDLSLSVATPLSYTSFEYEARPGNRQHIDNMLNYVKIILPFIFSFNDELDEVRIIADEAVDVFKRIGGDVSLIKLIKNDAPVTIPILHNAAGSVRVILGSGQLNLEGIPKEFLFYPLMDTAYIGINFIIHADDFKPNKERDHLHQSYDNEDLAKDVKLNETLLQTAFDLVSDKVGQDSSLSMMDISDIRFTESDTGFNITLKSDYIDKVKCLERIELDGQSYSIGSFTYFDTTLLLLDDEIKSSAYRVLKQFRKLPDYQEYCILSERVNNWNDHLDEKLSTLNLSNLALIIAEEAGGSYFYIVDKSAYQKLVAEMAKNLSLVNDFPLIPNIHGHFTIFEKLVKWERPEPLLIKTVDAVCAHISEKYIHEDFEFLENLNLYNREKFKDDFSNFCNDLMDQMSREKELLAVNSVRCCMLVQSLTLFVGLNKKTQVNNEVAAFYQRIYDLTNENAEITEPTVNINYQPAIKLLAHFYIQSLQNKVIAEHLDDLKEIIASMYKNVNLKEELLHKLACIPDQNTALRAQSDLKKDLVLDKEFKDQYDGITRKSCRNELVYEGFDAFLQHNGEVSGEQLGGEIEVSLKSDRNFIPVDTLILDTVLMLIEKISERPVTWGNWLPNINKVKEEILMHKFQNEKTRSSLFSILTKNIKTIELLGELSGINNLSELVRFGKEKQQEENRKNNHLQYISYIGLLIQDLIQAQLAVELAGVVSVLKSDDDATLTTEEEQNGQDFIIYKNRKPIYYIEVKSKWDDNGRFALSKNQTERCAEKKDRYAVISVNVDRYKKSHKIDTENIPFADLKGFVKVNDDLGDYFEKLVSENVTKTELSDPKLIEYRGSIPQKMIDEKGIEFDVFMPKLIQRIKHFVHSS